MDMYNRRSVTTQYGGLCLLSELKQKLYEQTGSVGRSCFQQSVRAFSDISCINDGGSSLGLSRLLVKSIVTHLLVPVKYSKISLEHT